MTTTAQRPRTAAALHRGVRGPVPRCGPWPTRGRAGLAARRGRGRAGLRDVDHGMRLLEARAVELAAQAQQRGLPARQGCRRLSQWVQQVLPTLAPARVARLAGRAEALFTRPVATDLAATRSALLSGQISGEHADVVTATVEALVPPAVPAGTGPTRRWSRRRSSCSTRPARSTPRSWPGWPRTCARPGPRRRRPPRRATSKPRTSVRGLTLAQPSGPGWCTSRGCSPRACGAALATALDAWSAPQPAADGTPDPRTAAQRRHDGLQHLAEKTLAAPGCCPPATAALPRRRHRRQATTAARGRLTGEPQPGLPPALLPDGTPLSSTTLAELACAAPTSSRSCVDDGRQPPGRRRTHTRSPRQAAHRDRVARPALHATRGCPAPPAWCDVHHLTRWSQGGGPPPSPTAPCCAATTAPRHVHAHRAGRPARGRRGGLDDRTTRAATDKYITAEPSDALDHLARRWRARQQR